MHKSDEELKLELANAGVLLGGFMSEWWHAKTGNVCHVTGTAFEERTLTVVVEYVSDKGVRWTRPLSEFLDGRFVRVRKTVGD